MCSVHVYVHAVCALLCLVFFIAAHTFFTLSQVTIQVTAFLQRYANHFKFLYAGDCINLKYIFLNHHRWWDMHQSPLALQASVLASLGHRKLKIKTKQQCMTAQKVRGSTPGKDSPNSGLHPFEVGKWVATITNSGWLLFEKLRISGTEGFKMVCVALQELTVTCNVSGDNG